MVEQSFHLFPWFVNGRQCYQDCCWSRSQCSTLSTTQCQHCRGEVDELATHGLSCMKKSVGLPSSPCSFQQHHPETLGYCPDSVYIGTSGLSRSGGKRPDGVTIASWKASGSIVLNITCPDRYVCSLSCGPVHQRG